jgi:hypothetical protein
MNTASAVWSWRDSPQGDQGRASVPDRKRVAIESGVALLAGSILVLGFGKFAIGSIVFTIAALVFIGGFWLHPVYRGFKRLGHGLAKAVGIGLSWTLLVPFFYICFTIGRACVLLSRRDPLQRGYVPEETSYWRPHRLPADSERYRKQY